MIRELLKDIATGTAKIAENTATGTAKIVKNTAVGTASVTKNAAADTFFDLFSKPAQISRSKESIDATVSKLESEGNLKGAAEFKKATSRDRSFRTVTNRVLAFGATAPVSIPLLFGKKGISNLIEVWGSAAEETVDVDGEAPTAEPETPRADAGKQNYDHTQQQAPPGLG